MVVAAVAGGCAVVAVSLSVLTSAQFVAAVVVGVRDDGAECDVVGEQVTRIELGLFQLHFVAVAAVGGH